MMAPASPQESIVSGAACVVGIDFGIDLVRSSVADAPRVHRSLAAAAALGSRAIVERFCRQGIRIGGAIAIGGAARKRRLVTRTSADVGNLEVTVAAGDQPVVPGATRVAKAAGLHLEVEAAQRATSSGTESTYHPDRAKRRDRPDNDCLALGSFVESELARKSRASRWLLGSVL